MFCPSIMSLAPPPVTPRRNVPPRLGAEEVVPDDVPQAARTLAIDSPAASMPMPTSSCRRVICPRRCISSRVALSSISSLTTDAGLTPSRFRLLPTDFTADQTRREPQVLGDQIGRLWISSPQGLYELFVIPGVRPPRIGRVRPQEHSRFGRKRVMCTCQSLAARHADELVMKSQVGRDRLLRRPRQLSSIHRHRVDRRLELGKVQRLRAFEQLAGSPGLDSLARDVNVQAVLDQALLNQVPERLPDGASTRTQHVDQPRLAQRRSGGDTAVNDGVANDAANRLDGRLALEPRQGPALGGTCAVL